MNLYLLKLLYICLLPFILILFSCRRYEEGGLINNTVENKVKGFKKITKYLVNGVDSLSNINLIFNNNDYYFSFITNDFGNVVYSYSSPILQNCIPGFWEISEDKKFITMQIHSPKDSNCVVIEMIPFSNTKWKIFRLKKNDMWLETTVNNKLYEMYFLSL